MHWYATKVFFQRERQVFDIFRQAGIEYYSQDILPSYVFVRCTADEILDIVWNNRDTMMVYKDGERKRPSPIPEREFEMFRLLTSNCADGIILLGEDLPKYHEGELVRIKEGPLKGTEGIIKRIKKDRKLVVTLRGVAAVAISIMHPALIEKIEKCS